MKTLATLAELRSRKSFLLADICETVDEEGFEGPHVIWLSDDPYSRAIFDLCPEKDWRVYKRAREDK